VAELVRRHFGVEYHPEHVRKVLKRRLGWTSQKPQRRAKERDEWGIRWWLTATFPGIAERAAARGAYLVFLDESGYQLAPAVRRTLAPRGHTPVVECRDRRDRISAISCITLSPGRRKPGLFFELLPDRANVRAPDVVAFLEKLRLRLRRFTVVWDKNGIHARSRAVREYLAGHPAVEAEDFPGYAPELNPDELVWGWTKYGRLANYAAEDLAALRGAVEAELEWLQRHPYALINFVNNTPLQLTG
jgi:transposase